MDIKLLKASDFILYVCIDTFSVYIQIQDNRKLNVFQASVRNFDKSNNES